MATSTDTGATYETATTATGNFTLASLPKGLYDVTVEVSGFSRRIERGVQVQVAQTTRFDAVLQIGTSTDSVVITAQAPLLRTENAEQSLNVSGERINSLPMNFGGGGNSTGQIRNWLSFAVLSPGVSGQDEYASLNGSPNNSFKIYLEGQDVTSSNDVGWESSVGAASVESIGEFSLQTSNYSAEFGQINGGLYNFTIKSGTNQLHGSAYEYFTNEALDASTPFTKAKPRSRKNDFGFSAGGPIDIPKLYHGRDKTFFFASFEWFRNKTMTAGGYSTVPTTAYRNGDFSAALTGKQLTTTLDPVGRTINESVVYDPASSRTVNGYVVRDPFVGNQVPTTRFDPVAVKIQNLIPAATNSNLVNNWAQIYPGHRFQFIPSFKVDHSFNPLTKLAVYYSKEHTDTIYWDEGLPIPITGRKDQPIDGNTIRVSLDKSLSPTLLMHLGTGFFRLHNWDSSPAGVLDYDAAGLLGFVGSATTPGGFPRISGLSSSYGGMALSMGPVNANSYFDNKLTGVASVTYVHGDHTFKAGGEFKGESWTDRGRRGSQGNLTFSAAETGLPSTQGMSLSGSVGFPYASFLLGLMDSAYVNAVQDPQWRKNAYSVYVQDTWKITRRLTLDYGLRWDRPSQGHEIWWRDSEFSAAVTNPSVDGLKGGLAYEGYGPGRCNCTFTHNYNFAIGPRLGVAYQIAPKTVFRAGIGVTYGALPEYYYMTNGTILGLGSNQQTWSNPAYGEAAATLSGGLHYNLSDLYVSTLDPGLRPSAGKLDAPTAGFDRNGGRPPRVLQWNIALQREVAKNLSVEAAYVGNRGVWLEANSLNLPNAISETRLKSYGLDMHNAADRTLLTSRIDSATAARRGFVKPYSTFPSSATVAQSLRPFPQFNSNLSPSWSPLGASWYDSLQVKVTKHVSHGLDLTSSFTFQKEQALGTGGYTSTRGGGINDAFNRKNQKGLASSSQPFILVMGYTYATPAVTANRLIRMATGGWVFGGILRYASGGLIGVPSSQNSLSSLVYQSTRMNRVAGQPLFTKNPNSGTIDPNQDFVLNPKAWSDASQGEWGTSSAYYNDYRWQHADSEQMSLGRTFKAGEHRTFQIRAEFFNVFNRLYLPNPTSNNALSTQTRNSAGVPSSGFGRIDGTTAGSQRNGQLVARFQF